MLLNGIILTCHSRIKEERTINAIFHLITGRRSIQTVQDAHLYGIHNFYGIYRSLSRKVFAQRIMFMRENGLLFQVEGLENVYRPTGNNFHSLNNPNSTELPYHYFNGLHYYNIDQVFIKRLLLYIQVLTNSKMENYNYIPIIDETSITSWMQRIYPEVKSKIDNKLEKLYNELSSSLQKLPLTHAEIFVERLTSYQLYGMSVNQLADKYKYTTENIELLLIGITHFLLQDIHNNRAEYSLLVSLIDDQHTNNLLTHSAYQTYELLQQHHTIHRIATKRQLKINTIYDHIVEIALHDLTFSISSFVNKDDQQNILNAIKQTKSTKLRLIKEHVHEKISYFQIRLVLARVNLQNLGDNSDSRNRLRG